MCVSTKNEGVRIIRLYTIAPRNKAIQPTSRKYPKCQQLDINAPPAEKPDAASKSRTVQVHIVLAMQTQASSMIVWQLFQQKPILSNAGQRRECITRRNFQ